MQCKKCGFEVRDNAFCLNCRNPVYSNIHRVNWKNENRAEHDVKNKEKCKENYKRNEEKHVEKHEVEHEVQLDEMPEEEPIEEPKEEPEEILEDKFENNYKAACEEKSGKCRNATDDEWCCRKGIFIIPWFLIVIPFLIMVTSEDTVMLAVFLFFLSLIVYLFIIRPIQCRMADNKYEDLIRELKQTIPEYDKMIEEWQNTSITQTCMEFMTEKYWNLEALDSLISLVEGKRAETFKEAINLYEDIQHQNRMETMQQEQLSISRDTNKRITSIQQTAANTERYAKKAAHSAKVGNVINTVNTVQLHNISKHTKK